MPDNEEFCRDGGPKSFTPALCAYGTQCSLCGPRTEVRSTIEVLEGDDSCAYANDGICQDGRQSTEAVHSSFVLISEGVWAHLCGYLTDKSDCGPGTVPTVSGESFAQAPTPPRPKPPPQPSPPPPPREFDGRLRSVLVYKFRSDGGLNSLSGHDPASGKAPFYCATGTQCSDSLCPPRTDQAVLCIDSCRDTVSGRVKWTGQARNGVCEDGGEYSSNLRQDLPAWSEIVMDGNDLYSRDPIDVRTYNLDPDTLYTFEGCADACAGLGGQSYRICK